MLSHADMVAAATADKGPLSIGGWVPPTTFAAPAAAGGSPEDGPVRHGGSGNGSRSGDGVSEPREPRCEQVADGGRPHEDDADDASGDGGGLVGYASSSESDDSGSDGPAERDRPVSFF